MSSITMMSEDNKRSKGRGTSTVVEEVSSGRSSNLKKGPWTSAEDAILVEYVNKHGEGNWNSVQKNSGLSRCGKSCRLRWANHLRPDLKKGAFTPEEERRIIELHAKWGNKWARMASELPGRTDNEIKNYWNTRIKRLLRAGLPVYPPDVNQVHAESEESQNMGTLQSGGSDGPDLIHNHHLAYPEVGSRAFDFSQNVLPYSSDFPSTPASNMLETGCSPSGYSFVIPGMHTPRHLRELETGFPDLDGSVRSGLPALTRWMDYTSGILTEPFPLSYPYDSNLNPYCEPPMGVFSGSHALLNGNSSSSQSLQGAMKLELPSLQYAETRQDSWDTSGSPLPSLESVDTFTLSPLAEKKQEDSLSPHKSGLLEAVLYESKTLKNRKRNRGSQASDDLVALGDAAESLSTTPYDTDWGTHADLISPLGYSAASVFSDSTPTSKTLPDEPAVIKTEVATPYLEENEVPDLMDLSRPDVLLGSCWF